MISTQEYFTIDKTDLRVTSDVFARLTQLFSQVIVTTEPADFAKHVAGAGIHHFYATLQDDGSLYVFAQASVPSDRFGQVYVVIGTHAAPAAWVRFPDSPDKAARSYQFNAVIK
jgi:hypothetical protein